MLACQREARCTAWGDGFRRKQMFYGRVVKDIVFKGLAVSGDGAFFVHLHHIAEDIVKRIRVEYGHGERVSDEVQGV